MGNMEVEEEIGFCLSPGKGCEIVGRVEGGL